LWLLWQRRFAFALQADEEKYRLGFCFWNDITNLKNMRELKITRLEEWANRRFNYTIVVDGQEQFEIASGQEKVVTIEKATTLQAKLMWWLKRD
jgi:hypothetical protein